MVRHFLHKTVKRLMKKENYRELLRYPVAGFSGFAVDYLLYLLLLYRGMLIRRPTKKLLLGLLSVSRVFINCYMSLKQLIVGKK